MTETTEKSRFAQKSLAALGIFAVGALVLSGCAAESTPTESAAETETATTTPGGCELGPEQDGDLLLKLGTALPQTGNLAFLGPPEEAGAYLAVDEINNAGKGITIEATYGDSGDTDNKAYDRSLIHI
jgi:branched-chain amino acid transport system substrate-binding protein